MKTCWTHGAISDSAVLRCVAEFFLSLSKGPFGVPDPVDRRCGGCDAENTDVARICTVRTSIR